MKLIRHLEDLPDLSGSVVTIGNFDGFHVGHRAILDTLGERGRALGLPVVAVTFEPHPLAVIAPDRAPVPISTPRQRTRRLEAAGVDVLFIQEFDPEFSRLEPGDFISRYLIGAFRARALVVGANFRFGHRHRGTIETLRARTGDFEVVEVPPVVRGGLPVSSSRIRRCLAGGEVSRARRLLGHCYEMEGQRVGGAGRGSRKTVPTLNMEPWNRLIPKDGVYVTRVRLGESADWLDAVSNVGVRPTFNGRDRTIETFVPDRVISRDEDGLRLKFLRRLRDECRFSDTRALRDQILRDVDDARRFFRRLGRRNARTAPGNPTEVRFYTRPGCHLCEPVHEVIRNSLDRYPLRLRILNVEEDPDLESRYGPDVPVVELLSPGGTHTFRHRLDPHELESELRRLWNT